MPRSFFKYPKSTPIKLPFAEEQQNEGENAQICINSIDLCHFRGMSPDLSLSVTSILRAIH